MFWKERGYIARYINVGLDFDGVLAHGLNIKIKYAKEWFGVDLSLEQTKEEGFNYLMKLLGKNINYRNLMDPLNEQHIMEYEIPPSCQATLNGLYSEGFRFAVVTSRNDHDYPYAKMFIEKNFRGTIKYVHNTRNQPKDHFVYKLRLRAYVDDDLKKLIELENTPAQLVYYRQPENKHVNLPLLRTHRIHEVYKWGQFYNLMQKLKAMHEAVCWFYKIENDSFHLKEIDKYCRNLGEGELTNLIEKYKSTKHWH